MKKLAIVLVLAPLLAPLAALAAGGSSVDSSSVPEQSPEELAIDYYNRGLKLRDKAWEMEEKAAASGDSDLHLKAEKQWLKAARAFEESISSDPLMYQAHGSLGYTYRKLGRYEESLGAYNRALELSPQYVEAIEYRAEAYLGLDRLEEAKEAYMQLFQLDRAQADALMTAMREWIEEQRHGEGSVSPEVIDEFAGWVEERGEIASQTAMLTESQGRSW